MRHLAGLTNRDASGWRGHYGLPDALAEKVARNELVVEPESGILFSLIDLVINACPLNEIAARLESRAHTPARALKVDLLTHEQFNWPFYPHYPENGVLRTPHVVPYEKRGFRDYQPDHPERLAAAIQWCVERGYQSAFYNQAAE